MIRSRMLGISLQNGLEHADKFQSSGSGRSICFPKLPRTEHHQTLCEKYSSIQIVWIFCGDFAHCVAVVQVELFPVGIRVWRGVAPAESSNQVTLERSCPFRPLGSILYGLMGCFRTLLIDRGVVVVGSDRECQPPIRHCRLRIQHDRMTEVTGGLVVVKTVK